MAEYDRFFDGSEETGPELTPGLSNMVNAGLRRKPNEENLRKLVSKYNLPGNIPNLKVPQTNGDVLKAMRKGPSIVDYNIRKAQLSMSKALVPILTWLHDFGTSE